MKQRTPPHGAPAANDLDPEHLASAPSGNRFTPTETEGLFAVNPNLEITLLEIDGFRILTADNFYKNPHLVREYLLAAPAPLVKNLNSDFYDERYIFCRHQHLMHFKSYENMQRVIASLSRYYLNVIVNQPDYIFQSNIFQIINDPKEMIPFEIHHDGKCLAASIFLNLPHECNGGTGFFRNLDSGRFDYTEIDHEEAKEIEKWHSHGDTNQKYFAEGWQSHWSLEYIAEMKFNRLVLYMGGVFHAAYFDCKAFKDQPRLSQIMFVEDVTYPSDQVV